MSWTPTRRGFLKSASAILTGSALPAPAAPSRRSATDWVELGRSGIKVTRLALGTGTFGGRVQRELGQEEFTRLVRHAYDRGIRFFETADAYREMPVMLGQALKGLPRDSYRLMTKIRLSDANNFQAAFDRFRRELQTEYLDILLIHCVRSASWPEELERLRDAMSEAKVKKVLLAHGASCHGLKPLERFPGNRWLDVALLRVNHDGTRMDNLEGTEYGRGDVNQVVERIAAIHAQGTGVIGMKIIGEGSFRTPEQRDASIRFVAKLGTVDAITIGYKSPAEIDEAIERLNRHLNG
ncbi:MAG: aldo/keto reductase [Bryobacteraceae bacterium]